MKNIFLGILCFYSAIAFAQIPPSTTSSNPPISPDSNKVSTLPPGTGISEEDAKEMRKIMKNIGTSFGVADEETKKDNTRNENSDKKEEDKPKIMPEVVDKALDLTAKGISVIAQNIEKAAPWVWEVMLRQQYANAISYLIEPWGLFIFTLVFTLIARKKLHYEYQDTKKTKIDFEKGDNMEIFIFRTVVPLICIAIFAIWGLDRLSDSIQILINPDYYAIKNLLQIIMKPGSL